MAPVFTLLPGFPDFLDMPWDFPLTEWEGKSSRLAEVQRGLSRHPVVFVNYDSTLYAIKALPAGDAEKEFHLLREIQELRLPVVTAVGYGKTFTPEGPGSALITRFLEKSLPYRSLFMRRSLVHYREHLLDAIAGLLVQLHLAGVYWGDCSLSNTLFRRDAGTLQAYLVDAETAQVHSGRLPPTMRYYDLEIMEENINADLIDLQSAGILAEGVPLVDTGTYIRQRYRSLWEEITREDVIYSGEHYRIHERIRVLNSLGFSVGEIELTPTDNGNLLRFRVAVTDRNFHRDQLQSLTGLETEERQAQQMMNEILELKATQVNNPLSVTAYHWLEHIYQPVADRLLPLMDEQTDLPELYCQVLEHKWYLSERMQRDVGHQAAVDDYLQRFSLPSDQL